MMVHLIVVTLIMIILIKYTDKFRNESEEFTWFGPGSIKFWKHQIKLKIYRIFR